MGGAYNKRVNFFPVQLFIFIHCKLLCCVPGFFLSKTHILLFLGQDLDPDLPAVHVHDLIPSPLVSAGLGLVPDPPGGGPAVAPAVGLSLPKEEGRESSPCFVCCCCCCFILTIKTIFRVTVVSTNHSLFPRLHAQTETLFAGKHC